MDSLKIYPNKLKKEKSGSTYPIVDFSMVECQETPEKKLPLGVVGVGVGWPMAWWS
jgi:hypothetical protein